MLPQLSDDQLKRIMERVRDTRCFTRDSCVNGTLDAFLCAVLSVVLTDFVAAGLLPIRRSNTTVARLCSTRLAWYHIYVFFCMFACHPKKGRRRADLFCAMLPPCASTCTQTREAPKKESAHPLARQSTTQKAAFIALSDDMSKFGTRVAL